MDRSVFSELSPFPSEAVLTARAPRTCPLLEKFGFSRLCPLSYFGASKPRSCVPREARLHWPLLFLPNPNVLLLFPPLNDLSLCCSVSESVGAWVLHCLSRFCLLGVQVLTAPRLPLGSPGPHARFRSDPSPLRSAGPHDPVPLRLLSLGGRRTHICPRPLSPAWSPGPCSRLFSGPRSPQVPSQEPDASQSRLRHNLPLHTRTHGGSGS